ncbi:hypothetical protein [Rathayibacter iranicus]|nr:hypothetical protein [Rathayibacter iranicus]
MVVKDGRFGPYVTETDPDPSRPPTGPPERLSSQRPRSAAPRSRPS